MTDKKNDASAGLTQEAPNNTISADGAIIAQTGGPAQAPNFSQPSYKGRAKGGQRPVVGMHSSVYSLAVKCYDEQLLFGLQGLKDRIRQVDPGEYQVLAIVHDRDEVADGIWKSAKEKRHIHVITRCSRREGRIRVSTLLDMLGICFRQGVDDILWVNHGVETVRDFAGYALYLTHETQAAIDAAKELYDLSEIISNLDEDGIKAVRAGYKRVTNRRVTQDDLEALDREAYDLGYSLGNFNEWYGGHSFSVRSHAKMKTIEESYQRGVTDRVESGSTEITRLCVFIQGPPELGKSYNAQLALSGKRVLCVSDSAGSGRFDSLRPDHEAIIMDDSKCPNLLNMADNYICRAYRRNKNNPVWAGKYLIVTSNKPFHQWLEDCGFDLFDYHSQNRTEAGIARRPSAKATYDALKSRFYVCRMVKDGGQWNLVMDSASTRGSEAVMLERNAMFEAFAERFNAAVHAYGSQHKDTRPVEYGEFSACWGDFKDMLKQEIADLGDKVKCGTAGPDALRQIEYLQALLDEVTYNLPGYLEWLLMPAEDADADEDANSVLHGASSATSMA